jgi:hypothetical protein
VGNRTKKGHCIQQDGYISDAENRQWLVLGHRGC